jgi:two-component system, cell cycle sensor histidine kinase and response regulator CckA
MSSMAEQDARLIEYLKKLTAHDRPCLVWENRQELIRTAVPFVRAGISRGDRCIFIGKKGDWEAISKALPRSRKESPRHGPADDFSLVSCARGRLLKTLEREAAYAREKGYYSLRALVDVSLLPGRNGLPPLRQRSLVSFLEKSGSLVLFGLCSRGVSREYLEAVLQAHPAVIANNRPMANFFARSSDRTPRGKRPGGKASPLLSALEAYDSAFHGAPHSGEWTQFLVDNSNEAIFILHDARLVLANRRAIEFTGYSYEELLSMSSILEIIHPDDKRLIFNNFMRRIKGDTSIGRYAFKIVTKKGHTRWAELSGGLIEWKGNPAALYLLTDITEKKAAEEYLRDSEERYRKLAETLPDPVVMYDLKGNIMAVNRKTAEIYGAASVGEFLAEVSNVNQVLDEEGKTLAQEIFRKTMETGTMSRGEYTLHGRNGATIEVEVNSSVINGSDGKPYAFISIARDITERKMTGELLAIQHEMAKAMSTAGDLRTGLKQALDIVLQIKGLDCGGVYVRHEEGGIHEPGSIELLAHAGLPREFVDNVSFYLPDTANAQIISQGVPIYTTYREISAFIPEANPVVAAFSLRAMAIVPVKFEGRVAGAIMVASRGVDDTPLIARRALEGMAAQIGGVIARSRVEEALRRSEENYRELMENANNIILRLAPDGTITYINDFGQSFFGFAEEEIQGRNVMGTIMPEQDSTGRDLLDMLVGILENPENYQNNANENVRKNGDRVWVSWTNRAIRDKTGAILDILSIGTDITERKRAEKALRKSEERFRGYFNLPLIGVAVASPDGRWIEVNGKICSILGYTAEELSTTTWMDLTPPEDLEDELRRYQTLLQGSIDDATLEKRYIRKDGKIISVEISVHCVRLPDGTPDYVVAILQDITDRKKSEELLIQALKMESVGRLAGGVAHDLNNLLTPIMGYSDLLQKDIHPDDPRFRSIAQIGKAAESAKHLTHQLLAFSRRQVLEMKLVDLGKIVSGFGKIIRRTIREDIEILTCLGKDVGCVNADIGQIEQILMNLAVNAQDAMPGGGVLSIRTEEVILDGEAISSHPGLEEGPYVVLEVSDTGVGMDAVTLEHIFEPFFTTKGLGMGTGLGLSTIYGIVNQHGGFVDVFSEPHKGSRFRIHLPRGASACAKPEKGAKEPERRGDTGTILIAEDNPMVLSLATEILGRSGHTVICAGCALECIEAAHAHQGRIDLLLTDVIMPDMNGKDLFTWLSQEYPHLRVVYMSGYTEDVIAHHGVLDQGVDFIRKPFSAGSLMDKIRQVLER